MRRDHGPRRRITLRAVLALHLCCLLFASTLRAQGEGKGENRDILVIGTGVVANENVARAKEAAVADALHKGVEQYLVKRLGGQGALTHFPRLVRGVISGENKEVENFNILAEERVGNHWKALVRVRINERVVDERFREHGIILVRSQPVKVLFLVSQAEQPQNTLSYWWGAPETSTALTAAELALHQAFEEFGFFPVNRQTKSLEGKFGPEMTVPDIAHEDAARWGELFSVPVVVQGRCEIVDNKEVHLSLAALGVEKSIIIDQVSQSETGGEGREGVNRLLEKAGRAVAARLSASMRKAVESEVTAGATQIDLVVRGLRNYRDLQRARESLEKEIPGVRSVKQAKVSSDSVGFIVDFSGGKEDFLNEISGRESLPFLKDQSTSEEEAIILRMR